MAGREVSSDTVLSVSHVSKKYCRQLNRALWYAVLDVSGELLPRLHRGDRRLRPGEFWALQDVSLTLRRGEALAVVGNNGAGKSTLLKLLHGLLKPDVGEIRIRGQVGAIIELGAGLNGELTGRENVRLGAMLHRLNTAASCRLLDDVVEFSELGDAVDAPLQTYSSGMKARLAYALQAALQPELLLVDEALAVGDIAFQRKCVAHMRSLIKQGVALLLVSHNTYQIQAICNRGVALEQGRLTFSGTAVETVQHMLERRGGSKRTPDGADYSEGPLVIHEVIVSPGSGNNIEALQPISLRVCYNAQERTRFVWGFTIWTQDEWVCVTGGVDQTVRTAEQGAGELSCSLPRPALMPGHYVVRVVLLDPETLQPLAVYGWKEPGGTIRIVARATAITNVQMQLNQLIATHVEWQ